jgi:hypothetical protein
MELTHILYIKVWSPLCNCTSDYNNIESKIKNLIANHEFTEIVNLDGTEHTISITWFKHQWENKDKYLISGDLVANIKYSNTCDQVVLKHTEMVLRKIEDKLKKDTDFFSNYEIIFNITKPLTKLKPELPHYDSLDH